MVEKLPDDVIEINVLAFTGTPMGEAAFALTGVDGIEDYTNLIAMDKNLIAVSNLLPEGEYVIHFSVYANGTVFYESKLVETSIRLVVRPAAADPGSVVVPPLADEGAGDGIPGSGEDEPQGTE